MKNITTELIKEIKYWKDKRNAVILAHNYQRQEVQEISDFCGDSLALAFKAREADKGVIVLCGVHFMAEAAAILNPDKTVLLPELEAGCPLANMAPVEKVKEWKKRYPDAKMIAYINTLADVKALSDIVCTSSNACKIVNSLGRDEQILFVPDKNLGHWVSKQTGRDLILYNGYCITHYFLTREEVSITKNRYKKAKFVAHPECRPEVLELADYVGSTSQIIEYCTKTDFKEYIIGTEEGVVNTLIKWNPEKRFYLGSKFLVCLNMKIITLKSILDSLIEMRYRITVEKNIEEKSKRALDKMLEISKAVPQPQP
ncbi:MAG: quinolinate synthase NadA [Candidatus Hydrogenedentota bacterium]